MKNQVWNTNRFIITNTLEVSLYILLWVLPVIGIMLFTQWNKLYLYIRLLIFFLNLVLWWIFSAIDIFKESKIKAIARFLLIFAFVSIFWYIAYVSYITSPHL